MLACLNLLPNYINAIVVLWCFLLLILAYVSGVSLAINIGKHIQNKFLPESKQSETLEILIGCVIVWTIFSFHSILWILLY